MGKRNVLLVLCLLALLVCVNAVFGEVVINEIMYNPDSTDAKHEWLEIYNNGGVDENLAGWKFNEANSDHALTLKQGDLTLLIGEYAIISDDADQFLLDYPTFVGTLFDSTFSLSNDGELIGIKDNLLVMRNSVTYSKDWNNNQEGKSIEKKNSLGDNSASNWQEGNVKGTPGTANNVPPQAKDLSANTNEDTAVIVTLDYSDNDNDLAKSCALSNIVNGAETVSCSCNLAGVCTVTLNPDLNSFFDITADYIVNDGTTNSNTAKIIVKINNNPVLIIPDNAVNEDSGLTYYNLRNFASDLEDADDQLVFKIDSQSNISIINCVLNADGYHLECTPKNNQSGESIVTITVQDKNGGSATDSFVMIVNPVNDAPFITEEIPDQETVEDIEFSYEIKAQDIDNDADELFISGSDSDLKWLNPDPDNQLLLVGTPGQNQIGTQEISVVVSDGNLLSEAKKFNLTVKPALEINSVKVNNLAWNGGKINVTPGEKVTIEYSFKNNHDTKNFGHVEASFETNPFFASEKLKCQGADCPNGYWDLDPNEVGKAVFNFEIPYTGRSDQFELILNTEYDDWWPFGTDFKDQEKIDFEIVKKDADLHISDPALYDSNLTCTKTTLFWLGLINSGKNPVVPEVLVYDQKPILSSFDKVTGKFTQFEGQPTVKTAITMEPVYPGQQTDQVMDINLSALNNGEHTLYLYVVNPYLDGDQKFIGDSTELKVKVGPCLNKTAIEKELVITKNTGSAKEINLIDQDADGNYKYLLEDKNYDNLEFGISDQTNEKLISCEIMADPQTLQQTILQCQAPKPSQDGNSELTVQIKKGSWMESLVEEKVTVTVTPGMSLSGVKVNSVTINENGDTISLKPDQEIKIDYTLTNYLDHPITGIQSKLSADKINVIGKEIINLKAGESKQLSLLVKVPYSLSSDKYLAVLSADGNDYENPKIIQKESFGFNLMIEQEPADLVISDFTADDEGIITCKDSIDLNVELTNKGSNDENNILVSLKGANLDKSLILPIWNKNLKDDFQINVPKINLTTGINTITVKISYRNGLKEDSKTVAIEKKNCLTTFIPEKTSLITADGKAVVFEVNLSENGFDSKIKWFVEKVEKSSGKKFSFVENKAGDYNVKAIINGDEEQAWKVTVTDKPLYSGFETNIPTDATQEELKSFDNLMVKNSYGQIVFNGPVDLTNIFDLNAVIFIGDGKIAINTTEASELNQPATLSLNKNFQNHKIQVSDSFNTGEFKECSETVCKALSNTNGLFVFTVTGFSTYWVVEEQPVDISISEILVEDTERGQNVTIPITVKNTGTSDSLTGLKTELYGLSSKYKAEIVGSLPATLEAGKDAKLDLKLTIPDDEDGGKHDIGLFRVISNEKSKSTEIYLNPKSYLAIESLKINGKSEGDLTLEEINKITVKVRNDYLEDMENVVVNVKILDVDNDDLEEESEEFDINSEDTESTTLEFDLSDEIIDEEEYELEITVTGETDSGSEQELTFTQTVKVAREKHQIIIKNAALSNSIMQCSISQTELDLTVENVGQSNEKDLTVKLENQDLGIDSAKEGIDLDKYSKDDNSESLTFSLDLEGAPAGSYPLDVKVYRGSHLEDSQTLDLVIEDCLEEKEAEQVQEQLAQESVQKLEQDLKAKQNQTNSEIKSSFRDTKNYVLLLGVMMFLVVIAICLGIAVVIKRKK